MKYLLTDEGSRLLARLAENGNGLHFTRAQTASGYSDTPEQLTALITPELTVSIAELISDDTSAVLTLLVTNSNLNEEHKIRQIGLFALDDDTEQEILFIVGQDITGDFLPDISYGRVEYRYTVTLKISNASNIIIDINDTDFLLQETFYRMWDEDILEEAFYSVFTGIDRPEADSTAMSSEDIVRAINTEYQGETSDDPTAMSSQDVKEAINTVWNGESSSDETALSAADIEKATTT